MNTNFRTRSRRLGLAVALTWSIAAPATGAVSTPQGDPQAVAANRTLKAGTTTRPQGGADVAGGDARPAAERGLALRCWQFGRLILEEPVNPNANGGPGGSINFNRPGDSRPLEMFSMGDAVCVIR